MPTLEVHRLSSGVPDQNGEFFKADLFAEQITQDVESDRILNRQIEVGSARQDVDGLNQRLVEMNPFIGELFQVSVDGLIERIDLFGTEGVRDHHKSLLVKFLKNLWPARLGL